MDRIIEKGLFASRWLLAPIYVGLVGALVILLYAFALELWHFAASVPGMDADGAIIGALALIDLSLVANLMLIVIFSGYENFVSRMDTAGHSDRPEWQDQVDFSALKLKLVASIVAISGIQLLKVFLDVGDYSPDKIRWMATIHVVFVVSGVLLALMDWITAKSKALRVK
ncbi:MAG: TIGR00645 family protein [Proteobacteria bacterium]|nr:TIGR00645 family protein [Pseudomonadota bacterium]MBS0573537.1 TIGR00645 family protein [Pseudomonadota bacterium]